MRTYEFQDYQIEVILTSLIRQKYEILGVLNEEFENFESSEFIEEAETLHLITQTYKYILKNAEEEIITKAIQLEKNFEAAWKEAKGTDVAELLDLLSERAEKGDYFSS